MKVLFSRLQGHHRHGAALHAVLGRAAPVRRDHPAHAALPSTRNLIGEPEFAAMKRAPLLINTARGGLVDEAALVRHSTTGRSRVPASTW